MQGWSEPGSAGLVVSQARPEKHNLLIVFGDMWTKKEDSPESNRGHCIEVFQHARGELLTGKGRSWVLLVQDGQDWWRCWTRGWSRRRSAWRAGEGGG